MDDNELMILVKDGNKEAFETLVKKYMPQAKAFACKYVHDSFIAEDIVQESFVDVYIQRFSFDQQYKFSTYLYTIIRNKAVNYLKKNKELSMSDLNEGVEISFFEQKLINEDTPETEYFRKEELSDLMSVMERLNKTEREMLYLYAVKECTYKEISEKLGMTVMQVKIKLFRARKKLREGSVRNGL